MTKRIFIVISIAAVLCGQCFAAPQELIPVGKTIGIELQTANVTVIGFSETVHAAEQAGLQKGDIIESINEAPIHHISDISTQLDQTNTAVRVIVRRNDRQQEYLVTPEATDHGQVLGILARDTLAGIGTVTYYDPSNGNFGALGHGVNDTESAKLVEMEDGKVVSSNVIHVEKSRIGKPGSLKGALDQAPIGTIETNTKSGIFGTLDTFVPEQESLPIAKPEEIQTGAATILSNISGTETKSYTCQIEHLSPNDPQSRNILLHITDQSLIQKTGGICQGMSGSPILQNGKLIGAVTHVLVEDPTRGYGIFIENMLDAAA